MAASRTVVRYDPVKKWNEMLTAKIIDLGALQEALDVAAGDAIEQLTSKLASLE